MANLDIVNNDSYDAVVYDSYPFSASHPAHLRTLGLLFGMSPTPIEKARVLELGCSTGGNLIPHAVNYPNAEFVGIDLSTKQIDIAKKIVDDLELKNIKFHQCSILDIDEKFGKFDYIIAHGVMSWVPELVRKKIFEISQKNMNPQGISYISYNTLPGWNMVRTIRDMMLYHTSTVDSESKKIEQAKLLLNFVKDTLEDSDTPYAKVLKEEAELLSDKPNFYLFHDHLEAENHQYYFADFMQEASIYNLQYLADSNLTTMYLGNMPTEVVSKLSEVKNIVRVEQYMDFIRNRRFRATLLCHSDVQLSRQIGHQNITKFSMAMPITASKKISEIDINDALDNVSFFHRNNKDSVITTSSPYMKAVLYSFAENYNKLISFDDLMATSNEKLGGGKIEVIHQEWVNNAMQLVLKGYLTISVLEPKIKPDLVKPKLSAMALYQLTNNNPWVTNFRHEPIVVSDHLQKYAFRYMDGSRDINAIIQELQKHIDNGELVASSDGEKVTNVENIRDGVTKYLENAIAYADINNLLF